MILSESLSANFQLDLQYPDTPNFFYFWLFLMRPIFFMPTIYFQQHSKNKELFGEKRQQFRELMLKDEQIQILQTNGFLNSKLKDENQQQKEHIQQYITQNLYSNQPSMVFDWMIEIKIFKQLIQSPTLMQNHYMYEILLECFSNVAVKLNLEEIDCIVRLMIQKLCNQEYVKSTLNILIRLTNSSELTQFMKVISQQQYVSILMQFNTLDTLQILSNIVCENYYDHLNIEQLIAYFKNYINNQYAIEALMTISDDERFINYLKKYIHLFQEEDDDRMVIVINIFNHQITSTDLLLHNLLKVLKQTFNRAAQLKICELIRKHQIRSQFDPIIQNLLWQNKSYLEQFAEDENLIEEVRDLINQIIENLEQTES